MPELTLHIYPQGHGHTIPLDGLCLSGRRLIREFLKAGWVQQGEYSLLLYDTDRVKIEIIRAQQLDAESIKRLLKNEERQLTIACWRVDDSDSSTSIKKKCLATRVREEILGDRRISELNDQEWMHEIRRRNPQSDSEFAHFVANPLGYPRVWNIEAAFLPKG